MPCSHEKHVHDWPETGKLVVYQCERFCGYCTGADAQQSYPTARDLREHVRKTHLTSDRPNVELDLTSPGYGNAISKKRSHSQVNHNDSDEEEDDDDEDKTGSPSVSRNKKEPETISDSTKAPLHLDADGSEIEDDDQFPKGHAASFRPIGPKHVAPPAKRVKQTADSPHGPPDSSASSQLDGKPGQSTRNVHVSGINGNGKPGPSKDDVFVSDNNGNGRPGPSKDDVFVGNSRSGGRPGPSKNNVFVSNSKSGSKAGQITGGAHVSDKNDGGKPGPSTHDVHASNRDGSKKQGQSTDEAHVNDSHQKPGPSVHDAHVSESEQPSTTQQPNPTNTRFHAAGHQTLPNPTRASNPQPPPLFRPTTFTLYGGVYIPSLTPHLDTLMHNIRSISVRATHTENVPEHHLISVLQAEIEFLRQQSLQRQFAFAQNPPWRQVWRQEISQLVPGQGQQGQGQGQRVAGFQGPVGPGGLQGGGVQQGPGQQNVAGQRPVVGQQQVPGHQQFPAQQNAPGLHQLFPGQQQFPAQQNISNQRPAVGQQPFPGQHQFRIQQNNPSQQPSLPAQNNPNINHLGVQQNLQQRPSPNQKLKSKPKPSPKSQDPTSGGNR